MAKGIKRRKRRKQMTEAERLIDDICYLGLPDPALTALAERLTYSKLPSGNYGFRLLPVKPTKEQPKQSVDLETKRKIRLD